jgi:hypothetical protein
MKDHADITWGGKMVADVVKARVWMVMIVDCFSVQSNIRLELMYKVTFNTRFDPVRILVLFHLNATQMSPLVNMFLLMFF